MTVKTAELRGRVVFVQDMGAASAEVQVLHREQLSNVHKNRRRPDTAANALLLEWQHLSTGPWYFAVVVFSQETLDAMWSSVVDEDGDVIWTFGEGGWTRTPERE